MEQIKTPEKRTKEEKIADHKKELETIKARETEKGNLVYGPKGFEYAIAPNGERSKLNEKQFIEVRSTNFKQWFGGDWEQGEGSKYIDNNGEPLLAYRTVPLANVTVFAKTGREGAIFFSPNQSEHLEGVKRSTPDGTAFEYQVYLKILNPGVEENCDGLIKIGKKQISEDRWGYTPRGLSSNQQDDMWTPVEEIKVFDPRQIKSATTNSGLFSSGSENFFE